MVDTYLFESNYILFAYDITNKDSFANLSKIYNKVT
jgi:GTPase SAR1 family protein